MEKLFARCESYGAPAYKFYFRPLRPTLPMECRRLFTSTFYGTFNAAGRVEGWGCSSCREVRYIGQFVDGIKHGFGHTDYRRVNGMCEHVLCKSHDSDCGKSFIGIYRKGNITGHGIWAFADGFVFVCCLAYFHTCLDDVVQLEYSHAMKHLSARRLRATFTARVHTARFCARWRTDTKLWFTTPAITPTQPSQPVATEDIIHVFFSVHVV